MSATKTIDANVTYMNAAILYHIEAYQEVSDEHIVRYPSNLFVGYKEFVENNCSVPAKRQKSFSSDAVAAATIEDIFNKIVDDVKTAQEDEKDIVTVDEFAKERPGSMSILKAMSRLSRDSAFEDDMKPKLMKDVLGNVKRKCKVTGRGRHQVSDALKADIANKFMTWLYHAAKYVAASLLFNKTQSISKFSDNAIHVGFFQAACDAKASLSDIYTLANSCDAWQIVTKVIVKKASPKAEEGSKKGGKAAKKRVAEVSDDEDDEEDYKPKKGGKKGKKPAESDDESDEEEAPKKSTKKKPAKESDDEEEAPKKSSKKASKIDDDEEEAEDDEE